MDAIHEIIAEVLRGRGLDGRVCYTHAALLAPDGREVEVECSDDAVADELRRRFSLLAGTTAVKVHTLPRTPMPETMLVVSAVGDVRRQPAHASELVSQVVYGDTAMRLKAQGEWTLARLDDGYLGWIRDWHLTPWSASQGAAFAARASHRVRSNHALVLSTPDPRALPVTELVVGTPVAPRGPARRGWQEIELPDGKAGFVRRGDLEKHTRRKPSPERLAATGARFMGIPYLWGGNTPGGFDCSGLIQRVFRLNGVLLPRDSDMQARFGVAREVENPADLEPGNLVFFGKSPEAITHVGLVLPDRNFLHSYGQVIVNSLDPSSPVYSARLASIWQGTRDPLRKRSPKKGSAPGRSRGNPNRGLPKKS